MRDKSQGRLREARKKAGFKSASAAARHFGWGEAAYRHHENGTRDYDLDQALAYGHAFNVDSGWLIGWSDDPYRPSHQEILEEWDRDDARHLRPPTTESEILWHSFGVALIPETGLEAGLPLRRRGVAGIYHALNASDLPLQLREEPWPNVICTTAEDDSMAPTIPPGARVFIARAGAGPNSNGAIWAVRVSGAACLRRVNKVTEGKYLLGSDNSHVPDMLVDQPEMEFVGKVFAVLTPK